MKKFERKDQFIGQSFNYIQSNTLFLCNSHTLAELIAEIAETGIKKMHYCSYSYWQIHR